MGPSGRTPEEGIEAIATRAHGVATRQELLAAGVSVDEINHRLRIGALLSVHPGVYRVGHRAPSREARYLAAVRACGEGALLCGLAAAHLHALIRGEAPMAEVMTPTERRIAGVRTRRSRLIDSRDAMICHGIPVTTVPRTLVDVAGMLSVADLASTCHEAQVKYGTRPAAVLAVLDRRPNSKGARNLPRILFGDEPVTLSKLESRFLARLRAAGLPLPETNRPAGGRRVDCRWPGYRLTVELDGYRYHHSRHAWEQDRIREREAYARGDQFRRYTYGDVFETPSRMLTELRALLSGASWIGGPGGHSGRTARVNQPSATPPRLAR